MLCFGVSLPLAFDDACATAGQTPRPLGGNGSSSEVPPAKRFLLRLLLVSLLSLVFAVGFEIVARIFFHKTLEIRYDERNLTYRYDALLGWFPRENSSGFYEGGVRISVVHNSRGFRDSEHLPSGRPRIAFVGDSFVWGYDVEAEDRFTDRLRTLLPGWEIVNLGVSGYGTAQELLLLEEHFDDYRPKIVFLVYQQHDDVDNMSNQFYGYYRPYFEIENRRPVLRGVPVPKSIRYYQAEYRSAFSRSHLLRALAVVYFGLVHPPLIEVADPTLSLLQEIRDFVSARGATLVIGLESNDERVHAFCAQQAVRCLDLGNSLRFPGHGRHWTPEGHAWVAARIGDYLRSEVGAASASSVAPPAPS
jgi:hypothetical protein